MNDKLEELVQNNIERIKSKIKGCDNDVKLYIEYLESSQELCWKLNKDIAELTLENQSLKRQLSGDFDSSADIPF